MTAGPFFGFRFGLKPNYNKKSLYFPNNHCHSDGSLTEKLTGTKEMVFLG